MIKYECNNCGRRYTYNATQCHTCKTGTMTKININQQRALRGAAECL